MVEIVVYPFLAVLDNIIVNNLGNDISKEFEDIKVTVATPANVSNLVQLKKHLHLISVEINGIPLSY